MLLDPRFPVVVGSVLLFFLGGVLAVYSPMPGALSAPHARIEGMSTLEGCGRCHTGEGKARGCLGCHGEIQEQLAEGRGYHYFLMRVELRREDDELACTPCHSEHLGGSFPLVSRTSWGAQVKRAFKHTHLDFSLHSAHELLLCEECHQKHLPGPFSLPDFPSTVRHRTFLGLVQDCVACHEDIHTEGLTGPCGDCHGQEVFAPPEFFDHAAHFPLDGGHEGLSCGLCHVIPSAGEPRGPHPFPFDRVRGTTCEECHESPHRAPFGESCDDCHPREEPLWYGAIVNMTPARHAVAGFRLAAPHADLPCHLCHPREVSYDERHPDPAAPGYLRREDTCRGCHDDVHDGQFRGRHDRCLDCHGRLSFTPPAFGHEAHYAVYPLTGAHEAVPCGACHPVDPSSHVRRFAGTTKRCKACHENPHGRQFADEISAGDCSGCHRGDADSFRIRAFDHAGRTGYPLVGAHARAECTDCHVEVLMTVGGVASRVRRFEGTPRGCADCHRDVHRGQFDEYGPEGCSVCHVTTAKWSRLRFDHNRQSRFPLKGVHARLECSGCHRPVKLEDGSELIQYKPLGRECRDCHDIGSNSGR